MNTSLQKLIDIIKSGSSSDVKAAQKQIEKIWHETCRFDCDVRADIFFIFLEELKLFSQIKDIAHQAYFINTLKWPLYFIGEQYFSDWSDFILIYIQHPSGKIRQAIIRALDYLIMDLRLDFKYDFDTVKSKGLNRQEIDNIINNNRTKFGYFIISVESLIRQYHEPRFNKYKYIDRLPIGVYKSLQMFLAELLRADFYEKLYQDFLKELKINNNQKVTPIEILNKRQQIEKLFEQIIKKSKSSLTLGDIKNIVYNENGQQDIQKIISFFPDIQNFNELQQLTSLIIEAWNYWPHKNINGLCPVEKL